jgi:DNA-directed RNA polymerase subunit RPC12/RpoP
LDGGQILRSLLWFVLGRATSLMVASVVGFAGVAGLIGVAIWLQSFWLGLMAAFIAMNCWAGFKQASALVARSRLPRRGGVACPHCDANPVHGDLWRCGKCGKGFDIFASRGQCPHCGTQFNATQCLECGRSSAIAAWDSPPTVDI